MKLISCALSVALALAISELGARALHHDAYPYLNLFVADARYGVRLQPSATTRVRSRDGRITELATNRLGFRGPEWPEGVPAGTRVLLLGDSQVLGYGVPFEATMGAQLQALTGAEVLAAAVPSWGPAESVLALEELGPRFHPTHVVFVANAANDWFEVAPNARRTTARDGWAAAASGAVPVDFPLRGWLLGRSHLVLAARQLAHAIGTVEHPAAAPALRLALDVEKLRVSRTLREPLTHVAALCRPPSCRLSAVALPLDVQVSAAEWPKYRTRGVDMTATETLLEDFVAESCSLDVPAVNLLEPLRDAEPGAFLADDYHLSVAGHAVVARALAGLIATSTAEVHR